MAAIPEAYTGLTLNKSDCEHLIAKLDTDYTTMKTRFYLDDVVGLKEGVVGLVNPLGANAKYHNLTTRGGKGRVGNMQMLNDGGLNTKPLAEWVNESGYYGSTYDGFLISVECFSAYYLDTDNFGIKWRVSAPDYVGAPTLANTTGIDEKLSDLTGFKLVDQLVVDSYVYFKVFGTNSEGVFESVEHSLLVNRPIINVGFDPVYASYAYTDFLDTPFTVKINTFGIDVGTQIYNGTGSSPWSNPGYFCNNEIWFQVDASGVVTSAGMRGEWPAGDPATPATAYPYTFFHFGGSLATYPTTCSLLSIPGNNVPKTVWQKVSDSLWYNEEACLTLASNGYYWLDSTNWQIFNGGAYVGDGNCTTGPIIT